MGRKDEQGRRVVVRDELMTTMGTDATDNHAPQVTQMLAEDQEQEVEQERKRARKTKQRPHEIERARRQLSVTFPEPDWREAVLDQAARWHVRTSDFLTFCVAYTMRAIKSGDLPLGRAARRGVEQFYQRAGENLDLPWTPEEDVGEEEDRWC